jgi:KaiC/GvpD/RAD55 family RecA-like ATPase
MPFFRKNLILIGALTGSGKSTATANITLATILQGERVLVITNEETPDDVYGRVVALIKGWAYTKHENFSDEQKQITKEMIPILAQRLVVIDHNYKGLSDFTTSIEGIQGIFDSLLKNDTKFGCIIIDYYQNVASSKQNPSATTNEISERFAKMLDKFKNEYPAPIVLLSQLMPTNPKSPAAFRDRIEGRKIITNVATCAVELRANREQGCSEWIFHKSRFNEFIGKSVTTGFQRGKYVKYDANFVRSKDREEIDKVKKGSK